MGVEVGIKSKGEGVRVGGRGGEVGEGRMVVGIIVGMGLGVDVGAQETRRNNIRKATRARFIIK
jgi:hypothetical protein